MDAAVTCQVLTQTRLITELPGQLYLLCGRMAHVQSCKQKKPIKNKWMESIVSSATSMTEFHRRGRGRERGGREHPKGRRVGVKTERPIKETRGSR